jgi:LmbE family N-acetylglucosaminyl deacetylase
MCWLDSLVRGHSLLWPQHPLPGSGRALALAPHPDDPDAIAVTLRLLVQGGWDLTWAILTPASSGVQDDFVGPSREEKARVREREEQAAAQVFGLPKDRLIFLRLPEDSLGHLAETETNRQALFAFLNKLVPNLVLLPSKEDTNATHRLTYRWFAAWSSAARHPVVALGNEDPKTTSFRADFQVLFGPKTATWKAALLECHRSQSSRNQATRKMTFAERILTVNRACPGLAPGMYAERFQVECWNV